MTEAQINRFAALHYGLINRESARRLGLTDRQIAYRVAQGRLIRLSPQVFAVAGSVKTPSRTLLGAAWQTGGVASHLSAAWLLGLRDLAPARPHISTARSGGRSDKGIKIYQSRDLHSAHITTVQKVPTTNATRTILDVAGQVSPTELQVLFDRAARMRLTHPDRLMDYFLQISRPGRPGAAAARRFLRSLNQDLALAESDLETRLLLTIRKAGLPQPSAQYRVTANGHQYRIDLCYPDCMLAIEGDGFSFHGGRQAFESDRVRQNDLVLAGWRVLRFTWRQICYQSDWVVGQIRSALELSN
jgi:very-short-patch-repair endonuclease